MTADSWKTLKLSSNVVFCQLNNLLFVSISTQDEVDEDDEDDENDENDDDDEPNAAEEDDDVDTHENDEEVRSTIKHTNPNIRIPSSQNVLTKMLFVFLQNGVEEADEDEDEDDDNDNEHDDDDESTENAADDDGDDDNNDEDDSPSSELDLVLLNDFQLQRIC